MSNTSREQTLSAIRANISAGASGAFADSGLQKGGYEPQNHF
jgi:hypothetical protein